MIRRWGKPGKSGKENRPEPVPAGVQYGAPSPGNVVPDSGWQYGSQPIPFSFARRLGIASALTSPMVAGRFRPQDVSSPVRRGDTADLGALQSYRGVVGIVGRATLGMQSGPSAMPAYPSTGQGGLIQQLAAMSQPDVLRVGL